ncbi:hypothetical protein [Candidatus Avelusimicrobium fimicolum]|jgi:hypothetical protein|uniref:hypothetical protein n=1 Tax=Candidatus Avelusimicrobium fimicolum TaxID=3416216 RepID=UPI003D0F77B4
MTKSIKKAGKEELEAVLNNHTADVIVDKNDKQQRAANVSFERADGLIIKVKDYAGRVLSRDKSIYKSGKMHTVKAGTVWEDIPAQFKPSGALALSFVEADFLPAAEKEQKNA